MLAVCYAPSAPALEHIVEGFMKHLGKPLSEDIIAWSYMDLLDRSTKNIQLSVSHKTLGELHPADIADIIEQLDPRLRAAGCSRSSMTGTGRPRHLGVR